MNLKDIVNKYMRKGNNDDVSITVKQNGQTTATASNARNQNSGKTNRFVVTNKKESKFLSDSENKLNDFYEPFQSTIRNKTIIKSAAKGERHKEDDAKRNSGKTRATLEDEMIAFQTSNENFNQSYTISNLLTGPDTASMTNLAGSTHNMQSKNLVIAFFSYSMKLFFFLNLEIITNKVNNYFLKLKSSINMK